MHMAVQKKNGLPRSMQDKLDWEDEDYCMVSIETC
jgi:hypothetical protein